MGLYVMSKVLGKVIRVRMTDGIAKEETITVQTVEEVEKLEAEGWYVVTDSDLGAGGEI